MERNTRPNEKRSCKENFRGVFQEHDVMHVSWSFFVKVVNGYVVNSFANLLTIFTKNPPS